MIELQALQEKFSDHWRPEIAEQMQDRPADAEKAVTATAQAYAALLLEAARAALEKFYADSPRAVQILLGSDPPENESYSERLTRLAGQKAKQRAWIEQQVAQTLAELTTDDLEIG